MQLARVLGTVVATMKHEALVGIRLLVIQPQDHEGKPDGDAIVACDPLQCGTGELVEWVSGREAAMALPIPYTPVDAAIVRICDDVYADARHLGPLPAKATRKGR
jgi:ethanolamine utilization protein EutN